MATKKRARKKSAETAEAPDPRAPIKPTPAACKKVVEDIRAGLALLTPPPEPGPGDLIKAMMHAFFADGLPCGYGQEAVHRVETGFVDRNEFRITEAFQAAELLEDLQLPDTFERCAAVREAIGEVYNDQNGVTLDFLREAMVSDRNHFFVRVPSITAPVAWFLVTVITFEECIFSTRSTQRLQQRLGFDPSDAHIEKLFIELRAALAPFGHLPLLVGPQTNSGKVITEPVLSPACLALRLVAKKGK